MICHRCDRDEVRIMTKSPAGDAWTVYVCDHCCFSWRSTEKIQVHDAFKLTDKQIAEMQMIPPIPPLKG